MAMKAARRLVPAALFPAAALTALACGGSRSQPPASPSLGAGVDAPAPAAGAPAPPAPCAPGQPCGAQPARETAALGRVYTTDPDALASLLAAAAAAGAAFFGPPSGSADDAAEAGLRAAAARYAPGMTPDGEVARGHLAEGDHVGFIANLDGSKCYAIVAYGEGIADIEVNLLAPPLYNVLAAQDGMGGPAAAIGAAPNPICPIVPVPVPYKVDLHAKKGSGSVAAQVYSRPR